MIDPNLGAGAAAIKTGILGLGGKQACKEVVKEVAQSAGSGTPPPYFFKLVEKIKTMGDDVTPGYTTKDRQVVKQYKDFELIIVNDGSTDNSLQILDEINLN